MKLCWDNMDWKWRSPDCVDFCLIGVCSITWFLEHPLVNFLFLEGAWSDTFDVCFLWLLSRFPNWTNWGPGTYVAPPIPCGYQACLLGASLVFPVLHSVGFLCLGSFCWRLAPSSRGVLGNTCLVCPWTYLASIMARLIRASLASPVIWGHLFAGASLDRLI